MQEISHSGKVISSDSRGTVVQIVSKSACAGCHAAGLCGASEMKEKKIVLGPEEGLWNVGESVELYLGRDLGRLAVTLAYVVPVLVLVGLCTGLGFAGVHELLIAAVVAGALAFWVLVLWLLKPALEPKYKFHLRKLTNN